MKDSKKERIEVTIEGDERVHILLIQIVLEESKVGEGENWKRITTVTCLDRPCSLFIDSGSALNGVPNVLVSQLGLTMEPLEKPFQVTWVDGFKMTISLKYRVEFFFGRSCKEEVGYDFLLMIVGHILLGRP